MVRYFVGEFISFGRFRGLPSPGFGTQPLENEAAALALGLPRELAGARGAAVTRVDPLGSAGNPMLGLRVGDVIDSVEGVAVAADESIVFRGEERLDWTHLVVSAKHVGQRLRVAVWRQAAAATGAGAGGAAGGDGGASPGGGGEKGGRGGSSPSPSESAPSIPPPSGVPAERVELELTLQPQAPLVPLLHGVDAFPSYLVFGGVVFVPLSLPALEAMFGRRWRSSAPVGALAALSRPRDRGGLGGGGAGYGGGFGGGGGGGESGGNGGGDGESGGNGGEAGADGLLSGERQQVVVLSHVLAHEVNHGLPRVLACTGAMVPVLAVDGAPLHSMAQLARMLDAATAQARAAEEAAAAAAGAAAAAASGQDGGAPAAPPAAAPAPAARRFVTFSLHGGPFVSMDCAEVLRAQAEILEANSIARDRSADLLLAPAAATAAAAMAAAPAAPAAAAAAAPAAAAAAPAAAA